MSRVVLLVVAAVGTLAGRAWAEGRATYGGALQVALPQAAVIIDPLSLSAGDQEIAQLVFDAPFKLDAAGQPRAHLAAALDPPPPGDGFAPARARLRIRNDIKFSDGRPVRASDVAASLSRALREPGGWMLGPIRSARASGDDLIELELSRPAPDLALLLSTPAAMVTPGGAAPGVRPIGSGAFTVDNLGDGSAVRLAAHANCFAGRPFLDTLTLRVFGSRVEESQSFEVGALAASRHAGTASGTRRVQTLESAQAMLGWLAIGHAVAEPLVAPLRAALALGVDRERLRRLVREKSAPVATPMPPLDANAARALLEQKLPAPRRLTVIIDRSRFDDKAIADRLLVELSKLGVDLQIEVLDGPGYQRRLLSGQYELALGASAAPLPSDGLAELAALAVADAAMARATLARAPAGSAPVDLTATRVLPLYRRSARLQVSPELRGVLLDAAGRASYADAWQRPAARGVR